MGGHRNRILHLFHVHQNIPDMKEIVDEFPDVEFVIVYVREAHPGERMGPHQNMEEKLSAAKLVAPRYGEHRRVLVDNLEGDFHRAYGAMPNVVYVLRPDGTIHYRCNWAAPSLIRAALKDRGITIRSKMLIPRALAQVGKTHMIRTMWTGGLIALYDFKGAPLTLAKYHKIDTNTISMAGLSMIL